MPLYSITLKASNDIDELAYFIAEDNLEIALGLYDMVETTFKNIADNPQIGVKYLSINSELQGVRYFPISNFPKYLAFYVTTQSEVKIIRVLHQARDVNSLLDN